MFDSVLLHIFRGQKYKARLRVKQEENTRAVTMGFVEGLESNLKNANVVTGIPGLDNEKLTGIAAYNSDVLLELYTA